MEKQWVLYIIECKDGSYYTGITDDLEKRMKTHGTPRGAKYTRGRGPFALRYQEVCQDHSAALKRELQVKKLTRTEKEQLFFKEKCL